MILFYLEELELRKMTIRILINGAQGKMGQMACEAIENDKAFELVGGLTRQDSLGREILARRAEVVLDLTRADSVFKNTLSIIENGAHPVIGTSGLTELQVKELQKLCKAHERGGLIIPNFSIAAVLMMQFAAKAAHFLQDVEIIESHHPQKFDAPSGTAIKTAQMIGDVMKKNTITTFNEAIPGVRGGKCHEVVIHSVRLPGIIAKQEIIFGNLGETLTFTHETTDRMAFKIGILLACKQVKSLSGLYYGLESIVEAL